MKRVPRQDPGGLREADILGKLRIPGIPVLYDVETDSNYHYIVMEYLDGDSVSARAERCGFSADEVLRYGIDLCRILTALHSFEPVPILYLDLQPENLMICGGRLWLVDFGCAMTPEMAGRESRRYGTPGFAAPELLSGGTVDVRTDIYGLGAVLRFMCTGKAPAGPEPEGGTASRHNPRLEETIRACLREKREERPESVSGVLDALSEIRSGQQAGNKPSLQAAVCGSRRGIGVTRMCLAIADYAAARGLSCIVKERSSSRALEKMARRTVPDRFGVCHTGTVRILPEYGPSVSLPAPDCSLLVTDCGDSPERALESGADLVLLICGTEAWDESDASEAVRFLSHCRNLRVLFRGAPEDFRPVLPEDLAGVACFRLPEGNGKAAGKERKALLDELFRGLLPEPAPGTGRSFKALRRPGPGKFRGLFAGER